LKESTERLPWSYFLFKIVTHSWKNLNCISYVLLWKFYLLSKPNPEVREVIQKQFGGEYFYVTKWVYTKVTRFILSRFMHICFCFLVKLCIMISYANFFRCDSCGNKSKQLSQFYELDLNIQGHTSLSQCIKEFLKVNIKTVDEKLVIIMFMFSVH
jgi:hypothetical protein